MSYLPADILTVNKGSSSVSGSDCEDTSSRALYDAVPQFATAELELSASGAGVFAIDHQNARGETDLTNTDPFQDPVAYDSAQPFDGAGLLMPPPFTAPEPVEDFNMLTSSDLDTLLKALNE